jgi:hypothetical protein
MVHQCNGQVWPVWSEEEGNLIKILRKPERDRPTMNEDISDRVRKNEMEWKAKLIIL